MMVKEIAVASGVTVEYLITGNEQQKRGSSPPLPDSRVVLKNLEALNKRDSKIVLNLIKSLKDMEDFEKKTK
ncbi:hypothetical protein R84B8_01612 [Treponema sp. R8-4-B8]